MAANVGHRAKGRTRTWGTRPVYVIRCSFGNAAGGFAIRYFCIRSHHRRGLTKTITSPGRAMYLPLTDPV